MPGGVVLDTACGELFIAGLKEDAGIPSLIGAGDPPGNKLLSVATLDRIAAIVAGSIPPPIYRTGHRLI
jgi:hypothetical protein